MNLLLKLLFTNYSKDFSMIRMEFISFEHAIHAGKIDFILKRHLRYNKIQKYLIALKLLLTKYIEGF